MKHFSEQNLKLDLLLVGNLSKQRILDARARANSAPSDAENGEDEETQSNDKSDEPPKLKDLQRRLSEDEDLVNLHDDFGDFEAADPAPSSVFEQVKCVWVVSMVWLV